MIRMNLHEFQSKPILARYGIPVLQGQTLSSRDELPALLSRFGEQGCVIKAQVHAGGRGKAGGVIVAKDRQAIEAAVDRLLGSTLRTPQTGPEGLPVDTLLAEPLVDVAQEFYLGMLVDRARKRIAVLASDAGGMSIEEVAAKSPERLYTEYIDPVAGLQPYQARNLGFRMGLDGSQVRAFSALLQGLARLFVERDASLVEINPLVLTADGALLALDAKINLDDNALYRHKDLAELRDESQEDAREVEARKHNLNYIHLDGDIGCMVNGAGLAMATMDLIKLQGGEPANFLDVGGGTTADRVAEAFKLILSDDHVRAVLVNIFGGIVRCDLIAEGIIQAIEDIQVTVPVVVRLEGTNAAEGRARLANSGLAVIPADTLLQAAEQVVAAAREASA